MTMTVDVREAETRLRDLLSMASAGDEVIIEDGGKALARLVPAIPGRPKRIAGLNRGAIHTSDDFDAPLPEEFWTGAQTLPAYHKDPFDRLLIAQATAEGAVIVTADPLFAGYPVQLLR